MRVAFVTATTRHHAGGDDDRAARVDGVAEQLAGRGHDITVLTTRFWETGTETVTEAGVTYYALAQSAGPWFTAKVPWVLRELQPQITHVVHEEPATVVATEFGGAPVVVDWYDLVTTSRQGLGSELGAWMWRRAARGPAMVITPSRLVETNVRSLGRPVSDIQVVPTGIEFETIEAVDPEERGEIVYARYLDAAANLEDLFLALAEFRTLDWRAVIIGDGPHRPEYEEQAKDLRIDDRVEFAGDLPLEDRVAAFKGAHAYVHTARRSSFPTDLLRAMACGCAGIVSYHEESSAHEFVETNPRGFLTTSPEEIADALEDAAALDRRTFDDAYEEYSQAAVLDRYLTIYRRLRASSEYR